MNQAKKRSGLGRGLASLIPTGPAEGGALGGPRIGDATADILMGGAPGPAPASGSGAAVAEASEFGAVYREIDPGQIDPNPRQPRQVFDEEALVRTGALHP